jgi:hypothetical protein
VARKPRDYKAEYARRNELAKQKHLGSYGQLRYGLEKGRLARTESGKVVATSTAGRKREPAWKRAGASSSEEYMQMKREVKSWVKDHPNSKRSKMDKEDIANPEIMGAYHRAFVKRPHPPGSLEDFLVKATGRVSQKEWDKNYAKRFKKH